MGFAERARWGVGTFPIVGTPTNIAYWIYSNSLPTAAALGTSYAASKYVVNPSLFKVASWMSKATGHPATYGQVAKNVTEWKMEKTLRFLGFRPGSGHVEMRRLTDVSHGAWRAGRGPLGPIQRYVPMHTGRGALRWRLRNTLFGGPLGSVFLFYSLAAMLPRQGNVNPSLSVKTERSAKVSTG